MANRRPVFIVNEVSIRTRSVEVLASLLVVTPVACGGDAATEPSADPEHELTDAVEATLAEERMRYESTLLVRRPEGERLGWTRVEGDVVAGRGTMRSRSYGSSVRPETKDMEFEMVLDGDEFWLTSAAPEFGTAMPQGREWVHSALADVGDNDIVRPLEPPAMLLALAGAHDVDRAVLDGRGTTYSFAIDVDAAIRAAPVPRRREIAEMLSANGGRLNVGGTVLVGDDGRLRQLLVEGVINEVGVHLRYDTAFEEFGADVAADVPDADDVVALSDVPEVDRLVFG
jgi:hypothetical protein